MPSAFDNLARMVVCTQVLHDGEGFRQKSLFARSHILSGKPSFIYASVALDKSIVRLRSRKPQLQVKEIENVDVYLKNVY